MAIQILTITTLLAVLYIQPLLGDYRKVDKELVTTANSDYSQAFGSTLLNVALKKRVTTGSGSTCWNGMRTRVVSIGSYESGAAINSGSNYNYLTVIQCTAECNATVTYPVPVKSNLQFGQNIIANFTKSTYLMSITIDKLADGETTFLTMRVGNRSASRNILIKVRVSSNGDTVNVMVDSETPQRAFELDKVGSHQFVIMVNRQPGTTGFVFFVNDTEILSQSGADLQSVTFSSPSKSFDYVVTQWEILYGFHLPTQALYKLRTGQVFNAHPAKDCGCTQDYPIFERWPTYKSEPWLGLHCKPVGGSDLYPRLQSLSHIPQFIADGDGANYWVSSNETLSALTIHLGTTYQLFYAQMILMTLPKHLVVTKKRKGSDVDDVLLTVTPNCSIALPAQLPQGKPLRCQDTKDVKIYKSNGRKHAGTLLLDWTLEKLYPGLISINQAMFNHALRNGTFEGDSITFHFYGSEGVLNNNVIIVNEVDVYGSCGCSVNGQCSLKRSGSSRRRRAGHTGPIATESVNQLVPISQAYTFQQVSGFKCECSPGYDGWLCDACAPGYYQTGEGQCEACGCGVGSLSVICDQQGKCKCDVSSAGSKPELANEKCDPFIHSVDPNFGPVAGRTTVEVRGGWLSGVEHVNFDVYRCYKELNKSSSDTNFFCQTPAVEAAASMPVYVNGTTSFTNFTYKPNPNITFIGRIEVFIRGGLDIPVFGENLDSVSNPRILVTVICKSSGEVVASLDEKCEVKNAGEMICTSPNFEASLRGARCGKSARKRKRRASVDDSLWEFQVGFLLDGVDEFERASKSPWLKATAQLYVKPTPKINVFDEGDRIKRLKENEHVLEITGTNLDSGASEADYTIMVGEEEYVPTHLYENFLKCNLPDPLPEAGRDSKADPEDPERKLPAIIVKVGKNVNKHVGYLAAAPEPSNVGKIVAVVVSIVVVLVAVIVVVVCIRDRRRRREERIRTKASGGGSNSNRYHPEPNVKGHISTDDYMRSEHMDSLKEWLIPHEHLTMGKALGQGQFGKVCLASLQMASGNGKDVAVKTMKAALLHSDAQAVSNFLQEAVLMKDFDHPNVLSLIGVVINEQQLPMVIIPFMSKGDMKHVLRDESEEFTVGDLIHFGLQASNGMDYLAKKKFIHRDLAARNCMVNEEFIVKIADFGLSHDIYAEDYYRVTDRTKPLPVKWMAIESLTTGKYTIESDVWSYGVLLWEIMTRGSSPYPGVNNYEVKDHLKFGRRLSQPDYCPDEVYNLMCVCWAYEPSDRPTFEEISQTLWTFMDEHSEEFERQQTKAIDDDYYTQPIDSGDTPIYSIGLVGADCAPPEYITLIEDDPISYHSETMDDYDVPVSAGPASPVSHKNLFQPAEDLNSNCNNANDLYPSTSHAGERVSDVSDGYMKPAPSTKRNNPNPSTFHTGERVSDVSEGYLKPTPSKKHNNQKGNHYHLPGRHNSQPAMQAMEFTRRRANY